MAKFTLLLTLALAAIGSAHPVPRAAQELSYDKPREGIQTVLPSSTLSGSQPGHKQVSRSLLLHPAASFLPRPDPAASTPPAASEASASSSPHSEASSAPWSSAAAAAPSASATRQKAHKGHLSLVSPLQILGKAIDLGPLTLVSSVSRGDPVGSLHLAWGIHSNTDAAQVSLVPVHFVNETQVNTTSASATASNSSASARPTSKHHSKHHAATRPTALPVPASKSASNASEVASPTQAPQSVSHSHGSYSVSHVNSHSAPQSSSHPNSNTSSSGSSNRTHKHVSDKSHMKPVIIEIKQEGETLCASYKPVSWPLGPLFQPVATDMYSFSVEKCYHASATPKGLNQVFVYDSKTRMVYPLNRKGSTSSLRQENQTGNKTTMFDAAIMVFDPVASKTQSHSSTKSASPAHSSAPSKSKAPTASVRPSQSHSTTSVAEPSATPIIILPREQAQKTKEVKSKSQSSDGSDDDSEEDCDDDDSGSSSSGSGSGRDDSDEDCDDGSDDGSNDDSNDDCDESDSSDSSGSSSSGSSSGASGNGSASSGSGSDGSDAEGGWKISLTGSDPLGVE